MKKYILALDQGTTSSRAILFNKSGEIIAQKQKEFPQIFKQNGYVEHNPNDIWTSLLTVAREVLLCKGLDAGDISSIGITNQRETTIIWDKETGEPVYNAIVWQCRRTSDYCKELVKNGYSDMIKKKTGLIIDPYFSATKIKWILDNVQGAREKAKAGRLLFGTVDSYIVWKLTDGRVHATDYSNASRTMLFNINTLEWDDDILNILGIPKNMLPRVLQSSDDYGYTTLIGKGKIKICGVAGDQQASLFGQACFNKGDFKCTYGTGAFLLMNTGEKPISSQNGLLTTIACSVDGKVTYALEGSVFVAGAAIQWLRDGLGIIDSAAQSEPLALSVSDTNGVYFVPAFVGLGAPYWNADARGVLCGLSRGTTREHIVRSALEAIAYQVNAVIKVMESDAEMKINTLKVDGGASENNFLMQFQSDITGCNVLRPMCIETTALGCAYLAGLKSGYWKSMNDIKDNQKIEYEFIPDIPENKRENLLTNWKKAVERTIL